MKRSTATILFILILLIGELSEKDKIREEPREESMVYIHDGRVFCRDGFFDLPKDEREIMLQNIWKKM